MVFPHKHFDDQPEISRTALELEANGTDVLSCPEGPAVIALERKPAPAWRIGSAMPIFLTIWHDAADWGHHTRSPYRPKPRALPFHRFCRGID
jgi:hypothetical protein